MDGGTPQDRHTTTANHPSRKGRQQPGGWVTKQHKKTAQQAHLQTYKSVCARQSSYLILGQKFWFRWCKIKNRNTQGHQSHKDMWHLTHTHLFSLRSDAFSVKQLFDLDYAKANSLTIQTKQFVIKEIAAIISHGQVVKWLHHSNISAQLHLLAKQRN